VSQKTLSPPKHEGETMSSQEEKAILLVEDEAVFESVRSRENVRKNSDKSVASQSAPLSRVSVREGYMETRGKENEEERSALRILMLMDVEGAEAAQHELRKSDIAFAAEVVHTRESFLKGLQEFSPDMVLADYSLPAFTGLAALATVRTQTFDIPFIFLTDAVGEGLAVELLKKGATDCVLRTRLGWLPAAVERAIVERDERRERVRVENELKLLEREIRQEQKMEALVTLSGGIAHDFNNILAAIIGFTELVADHVEKGSRDEGHLRRVMEAAMRGRELVRKLLAFSQKTAQEKKPLLLSTIVEETAKILTATTPTTISVRVKTVSEWGPIVGDPAQIRQILVNLWTNAVYAMREKGGVLDVELSDFSVSPSRDSHGMEPGLYVKLVVRDTGIGIEPDIIHRIFDPFFTTKKVGEGTGLGLSLVHGIVKQSNGYLTVESEPGTGSTFTVYLPARER